MKARTQVSEAVTPILAAACLCSFLIGCKGSSNQWEKPHQQPAYRPKPYVPTTTAGIMIVASNDRARWNAMVNATGYKPRPDPFALSPVEQGFENRQEAERLASQIGYFPNVFVDLPPPSETGQAPEPQPRRRLAGVLIGDSVLAIIEMGNGRPPEIVRPGQQVPGTEWTVVSIDEDKAVLRRGGTRLPHEVVVHLEGRLSAAPPANVAQPTGRPQGQAQPTAPAAGGRAGGGRGGGRGGG